MARDRGLVGHLNGTRIGRKLSFAAVAAAVALLGIALIALLFLEIAGESRRVAEHRALLDRSLEIRSTLRQTFSAVQDLESGERGYILTGDPEFLQQYKVAVGDLPYLLKRLDGLTAGTDQAPRVQRLADLSAEYRLVVSAAVEARQRLGQDAAAAMVRERRGKRHMDAIRLLVDEMLEIENRLIERHSNAVRDQAESFRRIVFALFAAMVVLIMAAAAATVAYIAQRRRSEEELTEARHIAERARGEAEEASRAKTDFLASMSHEIRTPLNGVIGYTELLFDTQLSLEQRQYVERIHFAGSALLTIVNDVLDFSRIEAARIDLHPHPFSLDALVDNTVSVVRRTAELKGLEMRVLVDPAISRTLIGDEARIRQVLLNLLNNAVKFTRDGKVILQIEAQKLADDMQTVRFAVTDTGIGIPEERRQHLFERFSQVDHSISREFGGSGLGLAISKRLVARMAGEIGFESEYGKGSTFWFAFPLKISSERVEPFHDSSRALDGKRSGRILLVEDLEHNRDLARTLLSNAGYGVDTAENGAEAVTAVEQNRYEVVLMDIQMPVMDGLTATRKIREMEKPAGDTPIIAMSANVFPQQVRSFREAGMNDHVGKPFRRADLFRKIDLWIAKGRASNVSPADDLSTIQELSDLMGSDWVAAGVSKLRQQIIEMFEPSAGETDREALARRAHQLVSHSALLGFSQLSDLSSRLEQACTSGQDFTAAFDEARAAAHSILARTESLTTAESAPG